MKKIYTSVAALCAALASQAQIAFPVKIEPDWTAKTVWMPKSPLKNQVIFVGGVDTVQSTATYGNPAGQALAKQWHDYIGFVKDNGTSDLGWAVVNHEMTIANNKLGDGGGMTMFKLRKNTVADTLEIVNQTLADGRTGKFFNVDFVNTVGETGMNCGGITTTDGRMWTAEEWMQTSNKGIYANGTGYTDTTDFVIGTTTPAGFPGMNGKTLKRYQNLNWMVEIDPKQAKGIRKQYNWGRAGWEGGVVLPDNKTVFLFEDGSPGILGKFVATTAGDFTAGQMYVYKHDAPTKWIAIENNLDTLARLNPVAIKRGATMFNRLEWGQRHGDKIYICETGRDAFSYNTGNSRNGVISPSLVDGYKTYFKAKNGVAFGGTDMAAADSVRNGKFLDYYGRVIEFDLTTEMVRSYIEGGPLATSATSEALGSYPAIHLSNPDGIDFMTVKGKTYMMIQEDLNGINWNRMPAGITATNCETYLLDMDIQNPTYSDLIRITACAPGAEITGAVQISEDVLLMNSQHPSASNTFPYNNSLTYAISAFSKADVTGLFSSENKVENGFKIFPNPTSRELHLDKVSDIAIYNAKGARIKVARDTKVVNVEELTPGTYFISNIEGQTLKFVVQ